MDMICREGEENMRNKTIKICLSGKRKIKVNTPQAESHEIAPQNLNGSRTRKVYFYGFKKSYISGSLMIEASLIIPLFLGFVLLLMNILEIYRVQTLVSTSVHESIMELGMYAYEDKIQEKKISSIVQQLYVKKQLPESPQWMKLAVFIPMYEEDKIYVETNIMCKIPLLLMPTLQKTISSTNVVNIWTGRDIWKDDGQMEHNSVELVYVSQHESVYHTSSKCTHLSRDIEWCKKWLISSKRNQYGEKYHSCEKCVDVETIHNDSNVFFTEKGDCYHMSESCSSIKRTVILIDKNDVISLKMCERCKNREYT